MLINASLAYQYTLNLILKIVYKKKNYLALSLIRQKNYDKGRKIYAGSH